MSAAVTPKSNTKSASKPSRIVTIHLKPALLAKFPSQSITSTPTKSESNPSASTPVADDATPVPEIKKPGARPGVKRTSSAAQLDGKPRGRPGPKKKPRLADGTIDRSQDTPKAANTTTIAAAHKLGPKANAGAINAGLRALDRTGKPCRRWERKGFQLKSFTGVSWGVGSWSGHKNKQDDLSTEFPGDVKSDSSSGMGDVKPTLESSAVASEASRNGVANGVASSPAPVPA